jgi:hypothetical protein
MSLDINEFLEEGTVLVESLNKGWGILDEYEVSSALTSIVQRQNDLAELVKEIRNGNKGKVLVM